MMVFFCMAIGQLRVHVQKPRAASVSLFLTGFSEHIWSEDKRRWRDGAKRQRGERRASGERRAGRYGEVVRLGEDPATIHHNCLSRGRPAPSLPGMTPPRLTFDPSGPSTQKEEKKNYQKDYHGRQVIQLAAWVCVCVCVSSHYVIMI